jgi:uncharacterized protein YqhQ
LEIHGGSALPNGVMFYSEHAVVTAKRNKQGRIITLAEHRKADKLWKRIRQIPILRGFVLLLNVMFSTWKTSLINLSVYGAMLYLSYTDTSMGVISLIPFIIGMILMFVALLCYMYFFTSIFRYHAAEHMVANAFDNEEPLTVANVRKHSRVHRYCGTNLVIFILSSFVLILPSKLPLIIVVLLSIIIGYEVFVSDNKLVVKLFKPFYFVGSLSQHYLFTKQPSTAQIEVAIKAIQELSVIEQQKTTYATEV